MTGTTFGDVVDTVLDTLQGQTISPDLLTYLTADVDATTTDIPVGNQGLIGGRGIIEIDDELMMADTVDSTGIVHLLPKGRGWRGTTAAAHTNGTTVTVRPLVPRANVKRAINDVVRALYPRIYGVVTFSTTQPYFDYIPLPAAALEVLDVRWLVAGNEWRRSRMWQTERDMPLITFGLLTRDIPFGASVQVTYSTIPAELASESTDLATAGLDACEDILTFGALARLIQSVDVARISPLQVQPTEDVANRALGMATNLAKDYRAQYAQAVIDQFNVLQRKYPTRPHKTR